MNKINGFLLGLFFISLSYSGFMTYEKNLAEKAEKLAKEDTKTHCHESGTFHVVHYTKSDGTKFQVTYNQHLFFVLYYAHPKELTEKVKCINVPDKIYNKIEEELKRDGNWDYFVQETRKLIDENN